MIHTRYDEIGRWYQTPEGIWCPSITTVVGLLCKDAIEQWRQRIGEEEADRISEAARVRGTAMHDKLETFCKGCTPKMDGESGFLAGQIIPLLQRNMGSIHCIETPLWSNRLAVAGRCDLVADWNGRTSVVDFKTATKPKRKEWIEGYFIQTCFYCVAAWQCKGIKADQVVILIANDQGWPQAFVSDAKPYYPQLKDAIDKFVRAVPADHFSRQNILS